MGKKRKGHYNPNIIDISSDIENKNPPIPNNAKIMASIAKHTQSFMLLPSSSFSNILFKNKINSIIPIKNNTIDNKII